MKKHEIKSQIRKDVNVRYKTDFFLLLSTGIAPHGKSVVV